MKLRGILIYIVIDDVAAAESYIAELGWKVDSAAGVIEVPSNPDNTVTSTVVQENIKLPRKSVRVYTVDIDLICT